MCVAESIVSAQYSVYACLRLILCCQAKVYALQRFEQLVRTSTFVDIKPSLLLELVSDDRLVFTEDGFCVDSARQEQRVLESVLQYITHDVPNRVNLLAEFLSTGVRLAFISHEMLRSAREGVNNYPEVAAALNSAILELPAKSNGIRRRMSGIQLFHMNAHFVYMLLSLTVSERHM